MPRRLGELNRRDEEIAVYDDLLARFGSATEAPVVEIATRQPVTVANLLRVWGVKGPPRGQQPVVVVEIERQVHVFTGVVRRLVIGLLWLAGTLIAIKVIELIIGWLWPGASSL